jgi:hypothetical protein
MAADTLLFAAVAAGLGGVAVLRAAWSRRQRSAGLNAAGWALLALAALCGGAAAGAWGVAVASLVAMAAASVALAAAAVQSPPGRATASNRRVGMLPEGREPRRIGRRLGTFAIVTLGGLAASIALGIGLRWAGLVLGWSEADANALAFIAVPIVWGVVACVLLMQENRRSQFATLLLCSLPLFPAVLSGA